MMGVRVMLVGAEDGPAEGLIDRVRGASAEIAVVVDGATALQHAGLIKPDLVLVQRPLPGVLDAFETCRALRSHSDAVLVIVPDHPGPNDELLALAVGADHLLPADTPLDLAMARLRSLVRRARGTVVLSGGTAAQGVDVDRGSARAASRQPPSQRVPLLAGGATDQGLFERISDGDLEIDLLAREVHVAGRPVEVTRIEFDLLVALARSPRRVLTREQLMDAAWDSAFDGSHVLDAHLSRLRCKIAKAGGERVAHAVRGVGYRLRR